MDLKTPKRQLPKVTTASYSMVLIPIVTFAIIAIASFVFVMPTWRKYQANQQAIAQKKEDLQKLEAKVNSLHEVNEPVVEQQLTELRAAMPEQKNVAGVIAGLSRLAQENSLGIDALQLKPGKLATDSAQQQVTIRLAITGDIKNVDSFLQKLAQIRRIFTIQKFSGTNSSSTGGFVVTLELAFYTSPLPTKLGDKYSDPLPKLTTDQQTLLTKLATFPIYTEGIAMATSNLQLPAGLSAPAVASPSATPKASGIAKPTVKPTVKASSSPVPSVTP